MESKKLYRMPSIELKVGRELLQVPSSGLSSTCKVKSKIPSFDVLPGKQDSKGEGLITSRQVESSVKLQPYTRNCGKIDNVYHAFNPPKEETEGRKSEIVYKIKSQSVSMTDLPSNQNIKLLEGTSNIKSPKERERSSNISFEDHLKETRLSQRAINNQNSMRTIKSQLMATLAEDYVPKERLSKPNLVVVQQENESECGDTPRVVPGEGTETKKESPYFEGKGRDPPLSKPAVGRKTEEIGPETPRQQRKRTEASKSSIGGLASSLGLMGFKNIATTKKPATHRTQASTNLLSTSESQTVHISPSVVASVKQLVNQNSIHSKNRKPSNERPLGSSSQAKLEKVLSGINNSLKPSQSSCLAKDSSKRLHEISTGNTGRSRTNEAAFGKPFLDFDSKFTSQKMLGPKEAFATQG